MDEDFFATGLSEDDEIQFDFDRHPEDYAQDGERCGICMDVVIDRGLLDCCEHWFCFPCIDNWATITNLCPLCQKEFQSITCVPVYDTNGSSKGAEEVGSRDDEWSIEEKNNTQLFPSYYIDENAVVCLDGDGCKLRSGLESNSEDPNMDTSIACDSCDLWYHAFCVGFDTINTYDSTWLCPRCTSGEPQKGGTLMNNPGDQLSLHGTEGRYSVESSLSSKVSVSIADTGETAVVVSMVTENQWGEASKENSLSNIEVGAPLSNYHGCSLEGGPSINYVHENLEMLGPNHLTLLESSKRGPSDLMVSNTSKEQKSDKITDDDCRFAEIKGKFETSLYCASSVKNRDANNGRSRAKLIGEFHLPKMLESAASDGFKVCDKDEEITAVSQLKRKVGDRSTGIFMTTPDEEKKSEVETIRISSKKHRTNEMIETITSLENETCSISDNSMRNLNSKLNFDDETLRQSMQQGVKTDIMTPDSDRRKVVLSNLSRDDASEGGKESGRRVKKIMRRSTEDKDSSVLLQRLREEIREAVQNKATKDVGELFNPKLLAAFRAAVAGPKPDQTQKLSSSALKMKKSLLQKGKVRENLTKKIYATSNGRRKRAWDRDCEIEFWKHRCLKNSKPEKIETLKSVLGLLRSGSEDSETGKLSAPDSVNPILSRLYLADTSIFPRKDDIRPVVSLHANTQHLSDGERTSEPSVFLTSFVNPLGWELKVEGASGKTYGPLVNDKPGVSHLSSLKVFNTSSVSKPSSRKQVAVQSDIRSDKRKWALEVLARKTAKPGQIITMHEQLEENTLFKENYPILAQLPVDMRPRPTDIRRNKIPMHVRQTQLYRLTEQLLKQANLLVIGRTAATELAVADAVNIEKGITDRSNSKLVYLNLCSQELLRHSDCGTTNSSSALNSEPVLPSADVTAEKTNNEGVNDSTVEEALKNAGLLPESPPGSPELQNDVPNVVDDTSKKKKDDRPDNVLEINSHSDLNETSNTSGVFEYGCKYEDHKDMNAQVVATSQVEGESEDHVTLSHLTPVAEKNELNANNILAPSDQKHPGCPDSVKGTTEYCQNSAINLDLKNSHAPPKISDSSGGEEPFTGDGEDFDVVNTEPQLLAVGSFACDLATEDAVNRSKKGGGVPVADSEKESASHLATVVLCNSAESRSVEPSKADETSKEEEMKSDILNSVSKKVEAFIKEHIRPLCKSGVITIEQYRWAVAKTTQKVMKYHSKDKNANFLIKEGDKVKKLAQQYVEGSQKT